MIQTQLSENTKQKTPPELAPFWESRITHDKIWYSQYVYHGSRFYTPHEDTVLEITDIAHENTVFELSICPTVQNNNTKQQTDTTGSHYVDNICTLAGALENGDLIHLDTGTLKSINEQKFLTIDSITIRTDSLTEDHTSILHQFDTPNGTTVTDLLKLNSISDANTTLHIPTEHPLTQETDPIEQTKSNSEQLSLRSDAKNIPTYWYDVQPFSKWTFDSDIIRNWVEQNFEEGDTILNVCAGKNTLTPPKNGKILRNDINTDRDADFYVDVAELASLDELEKNSIDFIVFDPPWSVYQSNLRYNGNHVSNNNTNSEIDLSSLPFETPDNTEKTQIGHARLAKEGFDWLLKPGGKVIEITQHGTSMPYRLGYKRIERAIFDPLGEGKNVTGSIDQKKQQEITDF